MAAGLVDAVAIRQQAAVGFTDSYDALPAATPVGSLHGLEYTGATVRVRRLPNGTQPIVPHSEPHFAEGIEPLQHIQSGGVSFDSLIHINSAQNLSSFDVYTFYFACAAIDGPTYGPARPCTVAVYGVGDGTRKYTATFDYAPASSDGAPFAMAGFNYPNFREIQNLTFGIVAGSAPVGKTALAIDSFYHLNYATG
ncbi:hypothetical protein M409DRAFT_48510 [Zasmidium cellare ATCC 36951]|uniref:Uncharacterized protein n=1 Tax=Zasmidium cellare ATCC 36951 TaxID=1080233 RepID=A0A6A6D556_ZASCE|nr:uncharacterized protein M409DRAFT_48510 [Zasmidium cellare ATCC 36951]KAF2173548.1 hypothetical protein M409DRAFT_48510 [Zasmidium cellare ATCC 36951]